MIDRGYLRFRYKQALRGVIAWCARAAFWMGSLLPLRLTRPLAGVIGFCAGRMARRQRRRALEHLGWAFGERKDTREQQRIIDRMFMGFGWSAAEYLAICRRGREWSLRLVENPDAYLAIGEVLTAGKGLLLLTSHLGNFELLFPYFASFFEEGGVVARRLHNEGLNEMIVAYRRRLGRDVLFQDEPPRRMLRFLAGNRILGMLPDQDIDAISGIFIDFFGRPAYTPTGPAALSLASGAPLVPVFMVRTGTKYRVEVHEPIWPRSSGDRRADVEFLTRAWSDVFEDVIGRHPEQWAWTHRRWRTTPERLADRRQRRARRDRALEEMEASRAREATHE